LTGYVYFFDKLNAYNIFLYYNISMFTDPVKNLKALGLRENMIVADLGAGSGFYTIPAAKMVPMGKVYAIEIQKDFLTTIRNKGIEARLNNLECLFGDVEKIGGTKIKDKIVDAVIASNILFQVEDKEKFLEMAKMPSREILLARLFGMMKYPVSGLAMVLSEIVKKKQVGA